MKKNSSSTHSTKLTLGYNSQTAYQSFKLGNTASLGSALTPNSSHQPSAITSFSASVLDNTQDSPFISAAIAPLHIVNTKIITDAFRLEKSVDLFNRTITNDLLSITQLKRKELPTFLPEGKSYLDTLHNREYNKMSNLTLPFAKNALDQRKYTDISSSNKLKAYKKCLQDTFYSLHGVDGLKAGSSALTILSLGLTANHVATSYDKAFAIRNEIVATLGGASFEKLLAPAFSTSNFATKFAHPMAKSLMNLTFTASTAMIGGAITAVADQQTNGNVLPAYFLSQSYFYLEDAKVLMNSYRPTAKAFADAMTYVKLTDGGEFGFDLYTRNTRFLGHALEVYNHNLHMVRTRSTALGKSKALQQKIFNVSSPSTMLSDVIGEIPKTLEPTLSRIKPGSIIKQTATHLEETAYLSTNNVNKLQWLGRGSLVLGVGAAGWNVYRADNKLQETAKQSTLAASGVAGGAGAAAAITALSTSSSAVAIPAMLCFTNPTCMIGAITIGGITAAMTADAIWEKGEKLIDEHPQKNKLKY